MTLAEIHARTDLSLAELRYVLDNEVIPNTQEASVGRGSARDFRPGLAILVALAAAMVRSHLRAPFVSRFIHMLMQQKSLLALERPLMSGQLWVLHLAGPSYIRILTGGAETRKSAPRWMDLHTKALLDESYDPLVYVAIDFARLRQQLLTP